MTISDIEFDKMKEIERLKARIEKLQDELDVAEYDRDYWRGVVDDYRNGYYDAE